MGNKKKYEIWKSLLCRQSTTLPSSLSLSCPARPACLPPSLLHSRFFPRLTYQHFSCCGWNEHRERRERGKLSPVSLRRTERCRVSARFERKLMENLSASLRPPVVGSDWSRAKEEREWELWARKKFCVCVSAWVSARQISVKLERQVSCQQSNEV